MKNWPTGLGGSTGDPVATEEPVILSGAVRFVHHTGSDSYNGLNRVKPFATLGAAVSASSSGDVIVCLDGHTQTVTNKIAIAAQLTIVGEGSASGVPTVALTPSGIGDYLLSLEADGILVGNIKIAANASTSAVSRVNVLADGCTIRSCYFECGATDTGAAVAINGASDFGRITDTTFISTATLVTAQPATGILTVAAGGAVPSHWYLGDVVFSGGTAGFSNFYAINDAAAAFELFRGERVSAILGADMSLASTATGFLQVGTSNGGALVSW